ncbi:MAG: hypothetical protein J1E40_05080 [Oscillospiraceae bacterium]|nr:hypothetical protein [Oscillospiraceae bacterium]
MEALQEIIQMQDKGTLTNTQQSFEKSYLGHLRQWCEALNQLPGNLDKMDGFNCDHCQNRGCVHVVRGDYLSAVDCPKCASIRKSIWDLKRSGLENKSFSSYIVTEQWQEGLLSIVRTFAGECSGKWLYIGGQSGAGKTHLCTAALRTFIFKHRQEALLFEWVEKSKEIKQCVNTPEYNGKISLYKDVPVLYIDDFFKVKRGEAPTSADINLAFELIDYRYRKSLVTIISSEFSLNDIISVDEALGSRIKSKAQEYTLHIDRDRNKNYRLNEHKNNASCRDFGETSTSGV